MKQEYYIQAGLITLRSSDDTSLFDVPLYVKVNELKNSGLAETEEHLLRKISDVLIRQHEKRIVQKLTEQRNANAAAYGINNSRNEGA